MKAKWLENSNTKIEARVDHDKEKDTSSLRFQRGKGPEMERKSADKTKQKRTKRIAKEADSSINPWSLCSTAAPRGSLAPARPALAATAAAVAADAATEAVTTTAAGPPPSPANITLEPSIDL